MSRGPGALERGDARDDDGAVAVERRAGEPRELGQGKGVGSLWGAIVAGASREPRATAATCRRAP